MRPRLFGLICGLGLLFAAAAPACVWDADTTWEENRRFPGTYEIVLGDFPRHSAEFHHWRIRNREAELKQSSRPEYYDDIAVSHFKLGDTAEALRVIEKKEELFPGLYETQANWSVFLMANGDWEAGLAHVRKALAINPDAHFGREKYQAWLAEYIIERKKAGAELPFSRDGQSFGDFVKAKVGGEWHGKQIEEAIQAVAGMLRFANHESPILLEAAATILGTWRWPESPKLVPASLYLAAARTAGNDEAAEFFRRRAGELIDHYHPERPERFSKTLSQLEAELDADIAVADAKFARWRVKEIVWIEKDVNPEREGRREIEEAEAAAKRAVEAEQLRLAAEEAKKKADLDEFLAGERAAGWAALLVVGGLCTLLLICVAWLVRRRMAADHGEHFYSKA